MNVREHVIDEESEGEYCPCGCSNCSGCLGMGDAQPFAVILPISLKPPGPPTGYDEYLAMKYGAVRRPLIDEDCSDGLHEYCLTDICECECHKEKK